MHFYQKSARLILLAACLVFAFTFSACGNTPSHNGRLAVGGEVVVEDGRTLTKKGTGDTGSWSYDAKTLTLTLTDYAYTITDEDEYYAIKINDFPSLTIRLEGASSLTGGDSGIWAYGSPLTIQGQPGSRLDIRSDVSGIFSESGNVDMAQVEGEITASFPRRFYGVASGIQVNFAALTMEDCRLTLRGETPLGDGGNAYGIYVQRNYTDDDAHLTIRGGEISASSNGIYSSAISAGCSILAESTRLELASESGNGNSFTMFSERIRFADSVVEAKATASGTSVGLQSTEPVALQASQVSVAASGAEQSNAAIACGAESVLPVLESPHTLLAGTDPNALSPVTDLPYHSYESDEWYYNSYNHSEASVFQAVPN